MNPEERKAKLTEDLNKAIALDNIYRSPDFQIHLLPHLQVLSTVQVIDPKDFESREAFARAAELVFNSASTYAELLKFLSSQESRMAKIREQLEKPVKNWNQ